MKLLVCGSRLWTDVAYIRDVLTQYRRKFATLTLIQGGCRGADSICRDIGLQFGWEVLQYDADWKTHGRAAGPIRNERMLREGRPDFVLAFTDDLDRSVGTIDMLTRAAAAGIRYAVLGHGKPYIVSDFIDK